MWYRYADRIIIGPVSSLCFPVDHRHGLWAILVFGAVAYSGISLLPPHSLPSGTTPLLPTRLFYLCDHTSSYVVARQKGEVGLLWLFIIAKSIICSDSPHPYTLWLSFQTPCPINWMEYSRPSWLHIHISKKPINQSLVSTIIYIHLFVNVCIFFPHC